MMEDFSGLALPPLFGEHILEAELEPGGVELGPGEVTLLNVNMLMQSHPTTAIILTKSTITNLKLIHRPFLSVLFINWPGIFHITHMVV